MQNANKVCHVKKKHYLCAMKSVVDISCFSSGKWLEMRVFDGLRGGVRLAGQTVDSCRYGLAFAGVRALAANEDSATIMQYGSKKIFLVLLKFFGLSLPRNI